MADAPTPLAEDDVDLALRHLTQQFPDDLARALLPGAHTLTGATWAETQLSARQRRMDRSLLVVADGVPRVEHVEWQLRWERSVPFRVYEYHALQSLALREATPRTQRVPRVRSTVVLLSGRERPWPARGVYRTSPRDECFSGVRFGIEPVYQRTVAELRARQSVLWMVFAPLAVDASPDAMPSIVAELRARTSPRSFEELAVAMTVLADADARKRGLREVIAAHLPPELIMQSWIYKQGEEKGVEKGRAEGAAGTLRQAIEKALTARKVRLTTGRREQLAAESRVEVLQAWFDRALSATRAADVFGDVPSR